MDTEAPIGIFDSGFGGLTVARAVIDQLPNEDIVYLGDTARAPYGEQPIAQRPRVRPGVPRPPRRPGRQGAGHRLQLRQRRGPPRRPGALSRAGGRGDPARRPARRGRDPIRPGRGDLHRGDRDVPGLRRRVRRRAPDRAAHCRLPAVRRVRRGRDHRRPRAAGLRGGLPAAARQRRHRHPDPRLHALSVAHRRDLLRPRRRRQPGLQRRGVRQGAVRSADPARPDPRPAAATPATGS